MDNDDDRAGAETETLLRTIQRRGRIVLAVALVAGLSSYVLVAGVPPAYRSQAVLAVEPVVATGTHGAGVDRAIEAVRGRDAVAAVADRLGLMARSEFATPKTPFVMRLLVAAGLANEDPDRPGREGALQRIRDRVVVERSAPDRIVVRFSSESAVLAAAVPNALAKAYLDGLASRERADRSAAGAETVARLTDELEATQSDLAALETGAAMPLRPLLDHAPAPEAPGLAPRRAAAEVRVRQIDDALRSDDPSAIAAAVGSSALDTLVAEERAASEQLSSLSSVLLDRHPHMRAMRERVAGLKAAVRAQAQQALQLAEADLHDAPTASVQTAAASPEPLVTGSVPSTATPRDEQARAQHLRARIASLEDRIATAGTDTSQADTAAARAARLVTPASVPTRPYRPKTLSIALVVAAAVLCLAMVWAVTAEIFAARAAEEDDGLPRLPEGVDADAEPDNAALFRHEPELLTDASSEILFAPAANDDPFAPAPKDRAEDDRAGVAFGEDAAGRVPFVEAERAVPGSPAAFPLAEEPDEGLFGDFSIAGAALEIVEAGGGRVVALSPEGDSGAALSVVLARLVSERGLATVLVDLTQSGEPTRLMEHRSGLAGVTDLLAERAGANEIIQFDRFSPAHFVPRGVADPVVTADAADALADLIDALENAYDVVLVECGPADAQTVRALADPAAGTVVVTAMEPQEAAMAALLSSLYAAGFDRLRVMMPSRPAGSEPGAGEALDAA